MADKLLWVVIALAEVLLPALKLSTAKEARKGCGLSRKTPRLCALLHGLLRIKVCT